MGIAYFSLRRSQFRKRWKIGLSQSLIYIHHFPQLSPQYIAEGCYFISQIQSFLKSDRFACLQAELRLPLLKLTVGRGSRALTLWRRNFLLNFSTLSI